MNLTKHLRKIYILSTIGLVVSVFCRIYFSNCLVTDNKQLTNLYTRKNSLEKEMSRLSYVESNLSKLSNLEKRSYELGFVKMSNTLVALDLNTPVTIAYNSIN